jgi:molybdenum cofactor cytidylyltransferase
MGGRAKALLAVEGRTFLETIVDTARRGGVDGVAVVVGHHAEEVEPEARRLADLVFTNRDPDRGMGSSAREAARALPEGAAMLLWPVDMPMARRETVSALLTAAADTPDRVVSPVRGVGEGGHPVVVPAAVVDAIRAMPADARVDRLLAAHGTPRLVEVDDPGIYRDFDAPSDLGGATG